MTLIELGIIIKQELNYSTHGDAVHVCFFLVETKPYQGHGCLRGSSGCGDTKEEALADYAAELCGRWIVVNANCWPNRLEFQLPPGDNAMTDPINEAIHKALRRDPLTEAEEITKKSYKDDKATNALGLSLVHDVTDARRSILSLAGDTYRNMPFDRFLVAAIKGGFKVVLGLIFQGEHYDDSVKDEHFSILWHPEGLLLVCDTYTRRGPEPTMNAGQVYYSWKPCDDQQGFKWTSTGGYKDGIFSGLHNYEALRYNMQNLRDNGEFVSPWGEDSLNREFHGVNLTHWMEGRAVQKKAKEIEDERGHDDYRLGCNMRLEITRSLIKYKNVLEVKMATQDSPTKAIWAHGSWQALLILSEQPQQYGARVNFDTLFGEAAERIPLEVKRRSTQECASNIIKKWFYLVGEKHLAFVENAGRDFCQLTPEGRVYVQSNTWAEYEPLILETNAIRAVKYYLRILSRDGVHRVAGLSIDELSKRTKLLGVMA